MEYTKLNLHITENCNYNCKHCFSKFDSIEDSSLKQWKTIIANIQSKFKVDEFNIAGGEPFCSSLFLPLVEHIYQLGIKCSLITNGLLMSEKWIMENIKYFSMIGFSIDSFDYNTINTIGRMDRNNRFLSFDKFKSLIKKIKELNPNCKIKVNTVVNKENFTENIYKELKLLHQYIDKWKILKMKCHKNDNFSNLHLDITMEEYKKFIQTNLGNNFDIDITSPCSEKKYIHNTEVIIEKELKNAYFIIDPHGKLLDNSNLDHKVYFDFANLNGSEDIDLLSLLTTTKVINEELYKSRY